MQSFNLSAKVLANINLLLICTVDAKRDFTVEIQDLKLTFVPNLCVKSMTSSLIDKKMFNIQCLLSQNVSSVMIKGRLDAFADGNRQMKLLEQELDFCQCLRSTCKNRFFQVIQKELKRSSNIFTSCPFLENKVYYLRNYTVQDEDYPPFTPLWRWRLKIEGIMNGKLNYILLLNGVVKNITNDKKLV